jgi:uncharacterized protein YjbI with pentapeptide repeats
MEILNIDDLNRLKLLEDLYLQGDMINGSLVDMGFFKEKSMFSLSFPNLESLSLCNAYIQSSNFENVVFDGVCFAYCSIIKCSFSKCIFKDCSFVKAGIYLCNIQGTIFENCNFFRLNITETVISNGNFLNNNLNMMNLHDSTIERSIFKWIPTPFLGKLTPPFISNNTEKDVIWQIT